MPFLSALVTTVFESLSRRLVEGAVPGLPTGLPCLDDMIGGGWNRQQLSYLVGDSGVGKSWLATFWMLAAADWLAGPSGQRPSTGYVLTGGAEDDAVHRAVLDKETKPPIIVFWSLEMAESPVVIRLLAQVAAGGVGHSIDSGCLMRGNLGAPRGTPEWTQRQHEFVALYDLLRTHYGKHIFLEFEARSIAEMRGVLDDLAVAHDICLLVVDYFRLIDEVATDGNMTTVQAERSKKLRDIAKEYDCHVLSIFDINREGQKAGQPQTYHMRGGVAAHYDADLVLTLAIAEDEKKNPPANRNLRHLVFQVAKGRFVAQSTLDLQIDLSTGQVEQWDVRGGTSHTVVGIGTEREE